MGNKQAAPWPLAWVVWAVLPLPATPLNSSAQLSAPALKATAATAAAAALPLPGTSATTLIDLAHGPRASTADLVASATSQLPRHPEEALARLKAVPGPVAALVRARAWRLLGKLREAQKALQEARTLPEPLAQLATLEAGLEAQAMGNNSEAVRLLVPWIEAQGPWAVMAREAAAAALAQAAPERLEALVPLLQRAITPEELDAAGELLERRAEAQERLGHPEAAQKLRLERYLNEPVSLLTPNTPPAGVVLSPEQALERLERLLAAHRSERVLAEIAALGLDKQTLPGALQCRVTLVRGLAARKLRHYAEAESLLEWVVGHCQQQADEVRRAHYLWAKVVSIRDGLRALPIIEAFSATNPNHTMSDDVLFWAGDLHQHRGHNEEALSYYRRVEATVPPGDQCAEARWRQAWMALRAGRNAEARSGLERLRLDDGCVTLPFERSRAAFWLGRLEASEGHSQTAQHAYLETQAIDPVGFYAQAAQAELDKWLPPTKSQIAPVNVPEPPLLLCPDWLAQKPAWSDGLACLSAGLTTDAALAFKQLKRPSEVSMGQTHAESLGVILAAQGPKSTDDPLRHCGPAQGDLLLALALDLSGAQAEAHMWLRSSFAEVFSQPPRPQDRPLWRAAYPLAFRDFIAAAEVKAGLPPFALQALAREESAFDPQVVSWAEAYGLTQLLMSTARSVAQQHKPPLQVATPEALLEPEFNALLGGALLGQLNHLFKNHLALALAAYNAGEEATYPWWKPFEGQDFMTFAEEIGIQETRGYVKRVLKTYGIYLWLYAHSRLVLPVSLQLPVRTTKASL